MPAEPEASDPDAILLLFILPNGTRLERRFRRTDMLKVSHLIRMKRKIPFELNLHAHSI